jgi:5-deoxy-glucuronate isomerase
MSYTDIPLSLETCVVRRTNSRKGRTRWVVPGSQAARYLHYGRIVLDPMQELTFESGDHETGLVALSGDATVSTSRGAHRLGRLDALYTPRGSKLSVRAGAGGCDLAEVSAPVQGDYPEQLVRHHEAQHDPSLHFTVAAPPYQRDLTILLGKNVQAGRLMAGVTFSQPGNWTSWPPHEHAILAEEAYVYIDMPAPAWGTQFVYTLPDSPEIMVPVREGDCVVIPKGYHPNVAAPGGSINFLWLMAAVREREDRRFGVVNVQPEYAAAGSGLDRAR